MNIKTVKKPELRIAPRYLATLGIKSFDYDNLYPQNMRNVVLASPNGRNCLNRYARFIEGGGLLDQAFSDLVVNRAGDTIDTIHHLISNDFAMFGGFALHLNYNVFCEISEINYVPFENCRIKEEDGDGFVSHIAIHPDWTGKKTRSGKTMRVSPETVDFFHTFNPRKEVVQAQIETSGGIDRYEGQIIWVSSAGQGVYPLCVYDQVSTDMITDEGISNVMNRNVKNNFLMAGMMISKKGQSLNDEDATDEGYSDDLAKFQGDTNALKILEIQVEHDEEIPQFIPFKTANFDKDFTVTEASVVERIYSAFNQEPFFCIRSGKIGFSGTLVEDAYRYYAGQVTNEQRMMARAYRQIFQNWNTPILATDFSVEPIKYMQCQQGT